MKKSEIKIQVETPTLLIVAFPENDVVIVASKFGGFCYKMPVERFCEIADRVAKGRQ